MPLTGKELAEAFVSAHFTPDLDQLKVCLFVFLNFSFNLNLM